MSDERAREIAGKAAGTLAIVVVIGLAGFVVRHFLGVPERDVWFFLGCFDMATVIRRHPSSFGLAVRRILEEGNNGSR